MSTTVKCPNPNCPYTFDAAQAPTGVVLSCPQCRTQFTLGSPAAPPRAPAPSVAPPGYGAAPPADEFEAVGRTAVDEREFGEPLPGRVSGRYQSVILAGIVAVLLAGAALALFAKLTRRGEKPPPPPNAAERDPGRNFSIEPFPAGWYPDDNTRLKVGSPYSQGYKREKPEAYVVFGSALYGDGRRSPRASEMRRDLVAPLQRMFTRVEEEQPTADTWLGQPVAARHGLRFRARSADELPWQGEAYSVAHQGIAYYWVGWSGESDFEGLKDEFAAIRDKFKLLGLRDDWRETVANEVDYKGATVPYTFTDKEDIWKERPIKDFAEGSPDLDRWLRISRTPRGDRHAIPEEADLRVYLIGPGGDPLQRAREYAQDYWTNRLKDSGAELPPPTFTELTDEVRGDGAAGAAKGPTPVVRLESRVVDPATKKVIAASESRLIVVSGARVGDKTVVLQCWCDLAKRNVFEARFVQIASSLR